MPALVLDGLSPLCDRCMALRQHEERKQRHTKWRTLGWFVTLVLLLVSALTYWLGQGLLSGTLLGVGMLISILNLGHKLLTDPETEPILVLLEQGGILRWALHLHIHTEWSDQNPMRTLQSGTTQWMVLFPAGKLDRGEIWHFKPNDSGVQVVSGRLVPGWRVELDAHLRRVTFYDQRGDSLVYRWGEMTHTSHADENGIKDYIQLAVDFNTVAGGIRELTRRGQVAQYGETALGAVTMFIEDAKADSRGGLVGDIYSLALNLGRELSVMVPRNGHPSRAARQLLEQKRRLLSLKYQPKGE